MVEQDGRVAVVRDVPVLVCNACGEVYLDAEVVKQLDVLFHRLLDGPVDHVIGHFEQAVTSLVRGTPLREALGSSPRRQRPSVQELTPREVEGSQSLPDRGFLVPGLIT